MGRDFQLVRVRGRNHELEGQRTAGGFEKGGKGLQILAGSLRLPLGPAKDLLQVVEESPAHLEVRDRIFSPLAPEDPIAGDSEYPAHFFFRQKGLIHCSPASSSSRRIPPEKSGVTSANEEAVFAPAPFQDGDAESNPGARPLRRAGRQEHRSRIAFHPFRRLTASARIMKYSSGSTRSSGGGAFRCRS